MHVSAPASSVQRDTQVVSGRRGGWGSQLSLPQRPLHAPSMTPPPMGGALLGMQKMLNKRRLHKGCGATKQRPGQAEQYGTGAQSGQGRLLRAGQAGQYGTGAQSGQGRSRRAAWRWRHVDMGDDQENGAS